jgi:hypothetical protein
MSVSISFIICSALIRPVSARCMEVGQTVFTKSAVADV